MSIAQVADRRMLTELRETPGRQAMARWDALQPRLSDDVPRTRAATRVGRVGPSRSLFGRPRTAPTNRLPRHRRSDRAAGSAGAGDSDVVDNARESLIIGVA